jgi:16S rRNA (adenine1518-N6/adenine1519-N6)-dimethyltransferase
MIKLPHPTQILKSKGLIAKKSFGQNFLTDSNYLDFIAQKVAKIAQNQPVAEIGAGLGALTNALLQKNLQVHAIEKDRDLIAPLKESFATFIDSKVLTIHEYNAVTFDYKSCFENVKFTLCGNLPYHLSSSLLFMTLDLNAHLYGAVFLLQKEVAERICAQQNSKIYGMLSVLLQSKFDLILEKKVPANVFWPIPNVDSAIVTLLPKTSLPEFDLALLTNIVKLAFQARRKTLRNSLSQIPYWQEALNALNISDNLRAENLSVLDFINITNQVQSCQKAQK